jgi:transcriptional regulator with XRE-family HTH domain
MRTRSEIVFPNNIKQFRVRKSLTQQQLGQLMTPPIGESAISKIESGERRLTNLQLADIARILGCQPQDIPVVSSRDTISSRNWSKAQQEVVEASIASGAAATGYVLAQLRKKNGKTMQQVASAIGMTLSVYHRVEMASRVIHPPEIDAVAAFYGMPPEELIELFERRSRENQEQLRKGVPAEQLLPRVPRSLLKDDAKWSRLGALESYVIRRSIRYVPSTAESQQMLPVYGTMKTREDGTHHFVIDRSAAADYLATQELCRADSECFFVRNFSQRLGFLLRPGSLALVDPRTPVALGDLAFIVRKDGSADVGIVIGHGIGPLVIKMYNPEEQIPLSNDHIAEVFRISILVLT